jgi:large-conductance mechanosensitive channel
MALQTLLEFKTEFKILGIAAFAGIFTWNFIRVLQTNLFTPLIQAYILGSDKANPKLNIHIRGGQELAFSVLIPEAITYFLLISILFLIWLISRYQIINKIIN